MVKSICQSRQERGNARMKGGNVRHTHGKCARFVTMRDDNFSQLRGAHISRRRLLISGQGHLIRILISSSFPSRFISAAARTALYLAAGVCRLCSAPAERRGDVWLRLFAYRCHGARSKARGVARAIPGAHTMSDAAMNELRCRRSLLKRRPQSSFTHSHKEY